MKIIIISPFSPTPVGHGGNHRAYQIFTDLCALIKPSNVVGLNYGDWMNGAYDKLQPSDKRFVTRINRNRQFRKWLTYWKNPQKIFWNITQFSPYRFVYPDYINLYIQEISKNSEKILCIIEHPGFARILEINREFNIPTICFNHNIESFDTAPTIRGLNKKAIRSLMNDFALEIGIYKACDLVMAISKVETGLLGGVGVSVEYYPYIPTGEIRDNLLNIRKNREETVIQDNLFLLMGSASHTTTFEGMDWFLSNLVNSSVFPKIKLMVIGRGTEKFASIYKNYENINFTGLLSQEDLTKLMIKAKAMLIPQLRGFGTLTRLSELSCAGIPTLCSQHPGYAIDIPPGITLAGNSWESWKEKLTEIINNPSLVIQDDLYNQWVTSQTNLKNEALRHLLEIMGDDNHIPS